MHTVPATPSSYRNGGVLFFCRMMFSTHPLSVASHERDSIRSTLAKRLADIVFRSACFLCSPLCTLAPLVALAVGCSNQPPTYPVTGRVAFGDGKPVDSGTVEFRSVELELNARGKIQDDGSYELTTFRPGDGAVAGEHRVIVVQHLIVETARPVEHGGTGHAHKPHRVVDHHYASYRDSPLLCSVSDEGDNVIDFKVESPPRETR